MSQGPLIFLTKYSTMEVRKSDNMIINNYVLK